MIIEIEKVEHTGTIGCYNPDCKRLPEYIEHAPRTSLWDGDHYWIKKGTIYAGITVGEPGEMQHEYYCRDCIDWLYKEMKSKLCSELWCFQ